MRWVVDFRRRRLGLMLVVVGWLLSCGTAAVAQTAATPSVDRIAALEKAAAANTAAIAQAQSAGDNAWMLVSAALVLLMPLLVGLGWFSSGYQVVYEVMTSVVTLPTGQLVTVGAHEVMV